jgi:hypothetical protein
MKRKENIMLSILVGMVLGALFHNQYAYEDCKKLEFKPKACVISEQVNKIAK